MAGAQRVAGGRVRARLLAAWAAGVVGVLVLNVAWPLPGHEEEWPWVAGLMAFPVAGAAVLTRRPGNTIGRLLAVVGTSAGATFVLSWYAQTFPQGPLSGELEALEAILVVLQFGGILGLLHLFPTGRPVGTVHRWVVAALWWYLGVFALMGVVVPGPMTVTGRPNPLGAAASWTRTAWQSGDAGLIPFALLGLWAVAVRWRRAGPVERAQLKWFFAGAAWMIVIALLLVVPGDGGEARPLVELVGGALVATAFWTLPVAVVVAVTRYRLFDIDRVISRTVAYALIAGAVGAVYVGCVIGLQALLPVDGSEVAIAGSTLAAAAVFGPVRRGLQQAVDRRFNRARYQIPLVTGQFAARIGRQVDADAIAHELCAVVSGTVQPAAVGLWLSGSRARPDRRAP